MQSELPDTAKVDEALEQLSKLIATGPAPSRVTQAVANLVAGWADEPDMSDDVLQMRVERLWDSFSSDASDLEAQLSDAAEGGETAGLRMGRRVLAAMNAAVAVFAAIQR